MKHIVEVVDEYMLSRNTSLYIVKVEGKVLAITEAKSTGIGDTESISTSIVQLNEVKNA